MIELKQLTKRFGDKVALDQLTMTIQPGEIMGLIGQNGAGKTTTFRMMLDFITPTSGSVTWDGAAITAERRQSIGFLPEERGLYQKQTIAEQVVYFAALHGMGKAEALQALTEWMDRLNVVGSPSDRVESLSKGNAQKVQFIVTVIFKPDFIILDEPFSGLDPVNAELMMSEIIRLRDEGAMILFSSHNMAGVERLSDKLIMLRHGKTVLHGTPADIRDSYGQTEVYLESSLTAADIAAIPGVAQVTPSGRGLQIHLTDPEAGRVIFAAATVDGYIPAFMQQPPSLEQIFRTEVQAEEEE